LCERTTKQDMKEKEMEGRCLWKIILHGSFSCMLCDSGKGDMQPYYGLCGHSRDKWTGYCMKVRTHDSCTQTSTPGFCEQKRLAKKSSKRK
jgi:hypothetical protein